jgi:hypothetical protein
MRWALSQARVPEAAAIAVIAQAEHIAEPAYCALVEPYAASPLIASPISLAPRTRGGITRIG